jgi:sulfide:quinone oxidoreductase
MMAKVLVLGGGFAGVEAAIFLCKQDLDVTLVSERDYFYIYPTSIWIPTGGATRADVSIPLDQLAIRHGFKLIIDPVKKMEMTQKKITLQSGRVLEDYDYIIVAIGQEKIAHDGMEHTLSICGKPEEADVMNARLDALIAKGGGKIAMGFGGNPKDTSAVRGGPAFEVLFNVHHYLKRKGVREKFELSFFAPMEKPGAKMGEKALVMMDKMFERYNISKKVGSPIVRFEENAVVFADGTTLASDFTMFIAAGKGHSVFADSGLPLSEAGYIVTNEYNEIEGFEGIYAIGDSAALLGPSWRAKQGHVAEVMARNVAYNLFQHMQRIDSKRSYLDHLNILCVMDTGDGAAFVYRSDKHAWMIPMPIIGHWIKKAWGWYCRNSKLARIPRLPGL